MDKPRTIRSFIRQRVWTAGALALGAWLLLAASGVIGKNQPPGPVTILGFVLFLGAIVFLNFFLKCPKCFRRLGHTIAMPVAFSGKERAPNFCPFCGVNLDEQIPGAPPPAENVTTPDKLIWK
jgi:hypothetical protein